MVYFGSRNVPIMRFTDSAPRMFRKKCFGLFAPLIRIAAFVWTGTVVRRPLVVQVAILIAREVPASRLRALM